MARHRNEKVSGGPLRGEGTRADTGRLDRRPGLFSLPLFLGLFFFAGWGLFGQSVGVAVYAFSDSDAKEAVSGIKQALGRAEELLLGFYFDRGSLAFNLPSRIETGGPESRVGFSGPYLFSCAREAKRGGADEVFLLGLDFSFDAGSKTLRLRSFSLDRAALGAGDKTLLDTTSKLLRFEDSGDLNRAFAELSSVLDADYRIALGKRSPF